MGIQHKSRSHVKSSEGLLAWLRHVDRASMARNANLDWCTVDHTSHGEPPCISNVFDSLSQHAFADWQPKGWRRRVRRVYWSRMSGVMLLISALGRDLFFDDVKMT